MQQVSRPSVQAPGGSARLIVAVLATLVMLGVMSGSALGAPGPKATTWLCKPHLVHDPCTASLATTILNANLEESLQLTRKGKRHPINCFYVYPTVSEQKTTNANLEIEPEETQVAIDQASRFSQDCKVYAPMYPQLTLAAINTPGAVTPAASLKAYLAVRAAFEEFLSKYNKGNGFVLLGHSQGSFVLEQLIKEVVDPSAELRNKLVSAVLLGGNVTVREGELAGGSFQNVPLCQAADETHCVIAYSSFFKEPPNPSNFGRPSSPLVGPGVPGTEVACVNPTLLRQTGGTGPLDHYESTTTFPGVLGTLEATPASKLGTPWLRLPGQYTAQCRKEHGASWLQVNPVSPGDRRESVAEVLGPEWGLHLFDYNLALGNLVKTVAIQAATYAFESTY